MDTPENPLYGRMLRGRLDEAVRRSRPLTEAGKDREHLYRKLAMAAGPDWKVTDDDLDIIYEYVGPDRERHSLASMHVTVSLDDLIYDGVTLAITEYSSDWDHGGSRGVKRRKNRVRTEMDVKKVLIKAKAFWKKCHAPYREDFEFPKPTAEIALMAESLIARL